MTFDDDLTAEEWRKQEMRDAAEDMVRFEREHRFREEEPLDPEEARQNVIDAGGQ